MGTPRTRRTGLSRIRAELPSHHQFHGGRGIVFTAQLCLERTHPLPTKKNEVAKVPRPQSGRFLSESTAPSSSHYDNILHNAIRPKKGLHVFMRLRHPQQPQVTGGKRKTTPKYLFCGFLLVLWVLLSLIWGLVHRKNSTETARMSASKTLRAVTQVVQGQKMSEGAGVKICRTVGTGKLKNLDPYLLLDELRLPSHKATAGFPDHPHRGFETCTIMLEGKMEHKDSVGNQGVIGPGGVQWMTAGRGIVHSEMPAVTTGDLWGFQLWINLPAKNKMVKPRYQDYQAEDIPVVEKNGMRVRVMAGESYGAIGPIKMQNPGMLLDVQLEKGADFQQQVPEEWNGFAYVSDGEGEVSGAKTSKEQALVLGPGDHITANTTSDKGLRFLLVAGKPIGEPIVQHGPFVMNTQDEIRQAFMDYQTGRLQNPKDDVWAD